MKSSSVNFKIMRLTIALSLFLVSLSLSAQTGDIRGTVIDEGFGEPIIGANVLVKELADAGVGASTDLDGEFTISLEPGTYTLKFPTSDSATLQLKMSRSPKEK